MRPGVIFGGPSPEHDISVLTGLQSVRALGDAIAIYWAKTGELFEVDADLEGGDFAAGAPAKARPVRLVTGEGLLGRRDKPLDLTAVVNCCHGGPGEDGSLQGAFDLAGIRYTGPTVAGAALGMDKLAFGNAAAAAGMASLPRAVLTEATSVDFAGPYIVKPRFGGSSIGVETVADIETARARIGANVHLRAGAIIEPYKAEAIDLNIAIRSYPHVELSAIERPQRTQSDGTILDYRDKYVGGEGMASAPRDIPADIPAELAERIRSQATVIGTLAGVRGIARIDFLLDGEDLYVNEINTIPGSLAKYLWIDPPVAFAKLLTDMLEEAEQRPTTHYTTAGADGTALRSAGTIASKLG
jgi:D-alanine-D-alanine ligase